jgi:hypothetical protein
MRQIALLLLLAACTSACATRAPATPEAVFFSRLKALCGQSFDGKLVTSDAADADMRSQPLTMRVRNCTRNEVRIPFEVGQDRSRTWVVTRTGSGLRLKHDHRHADGTPDVRTNYGGDSRAALGAERIEFPADVFSQDLFKTQGIPQSATNVWALELRPGEAFAYELRRAGRHFRVEFPLQPLPNRIMPMSAPAGRE